MNDSFLLGVMLKITGLTKKEIELISNNELIISEKRNSTNVREHLLFESRIEISFLKSLYIKGVNMKRLAKNFHLSQEEVMENLGNQHYFFNQINFEKKSNEELKNKMINFLIEEKFSNLVVQELLKIKYKR